MDLLSNFPFPLLQSGRLYTYPTVTNNLKTDVVILGAGITGALITRYLSQAGIDSITIDKGHPGMSSTAACTSLLQYEIDTPLHALSRMVGEEHAIRSYILCREAIYELQGVCNSLEPVEFEIKPSFQFASYNKHVKDLLTEFQLRKKSGFDLEYLDPKEIKNRFGFTKPGGLLSADGGSVDTYNLTHALLQQATGKSSQVYDQTSVQEIQYKRQGVRLTTTSGFTISAKKMIIACGYESLKFIDKKVADLNSTYVIVSKPIQVTEPWYKNALIWETARPYLYMRPTHDNRIIVGGRDEAFYDPQKRDAALIKKAADLKNDFSKLFPDVPFFTDFQWAGTFGTTSDGLPFIGKIPKRPHTWFALGFGGNGITFSVIAARILRDILSGRNNKDIELFSFNR